MTSTGSISAIAINSNSAGGRALSAGSQPGECSRYQQPGKSPAHCADAAGCPDRDEEEAAAAPASDRCGRSNYQEERRRVRRLVSAFRFWRSKAEMSSAAEAAALAEDASQPIACTGAIATPSADRMATSGRQLQPQQQQPATSAPIRAQHPSRAPAQPQHDVTNNPNNRPEHQSIIFIPSSYIEHQISLTPSLANETLRETKRFWQNLVLPLVLGCLIILVVVWTRQIMFFLVNDTIVMVIILGAVFVIMSAMAFWLAQDQQFSLDHNEPTQNYEQTSNEEFPGEQHQFCLCNSPAHFETYCHHSQRHYNNHHQGEFAATGRKCCQGIAYINCQPPDYYSALKNSAPVRLADFGQSRQGPASTSNATEELRVASLEPPSYEEFFASQSADCLKTFKY